MRLSCFPRLSSLLETMAARVGARSGNSEGRVFLVQPWTMGVGGWRLPGAVCSV